MSFFPGFFLVMFSVSDISKNTFPPRTRKIDQVLIKYQWILKTNMKVGRRDRIYLVFLMLKNMNRCDRCMITI